MLKTFFNFLTFLKTLIFIYFNVLKISRLQFVYNILQLSMTMIVRDGKI